MVKSNIEVKPIFINGKWCEVDTPNDLEKAKAYIQGGGNIEAIKQKYKLSPEIESELTKL